MKNFKLSLIISFLFALNSNAIIAQETDKKEEMIEQLKIAKEQLSLSEKQELSFREITKKYAIKLKEIKNNDSNKQDKMKMLKESRTAKDAEIKLLLTEEQYDKYLQMLEERRSQMTNRKRD